MTDDPARQAAEALAIEALGFIASDEKLLPRFLALTGIEVRHIRQAAAEPGFLAGVLAFVAAYEPTLLEFAAASGRNPASVRKAMQALPVGEEKWDISS